MQRGGNCSSYYQATTSAFSAVSSKTTKESWDNAKSFAATAKLNLGAAALKLIKAQYNTKLCNEQHIYGKQKIIITTDALKGDPNNKTKQDAATQAASNIIQLEIKNNTAIAVENQLLLEHNILEGVSKRLSANAEVAQKAYEDSTKHNAEEASAATATKQDKTTVAVSTKAQDAAIILIKAQREFNSLSKKNAINLAEVKKAAKNATTIAQESTDAAKQTAIQTDITAAGAKRVAAVKQTQDAETQSNAAKSQQNAADKLEQTYTDTAKERLTNLQALAEKLRIANALFKTPAKQTRVATATLKAEEASVNTKAEAVTQTKVEAVVTPKENKVAEVPAAVGVLTNLELPAVKKIPDDVYNTHITNSNTWVIQIKNLFITSATQVSELYKSAAATAHNFSSKPSPYMISIVTQIQSYNTRITNTCNSFDTIYKTFFDTPLLIDLNVTDNLNKINYKKWIEAFNKICLQLIIIIISCIDQIYLLINVTVIYGNISSTPPTITIPTVETNVLTPNDFMTNTLREQYVIDYNNAYVNVTKQGDSINTYTTKLINASQIVSNMVTFIITYCTYVINVMNVTTDEKLKIWYGTTITLNDYTTCKQYITKINTQLETISTNLILNTPNTKNIIADAFVLVQTNSKLHDIVSTFILPELSGGSRHKKSLSLKKNKMHKRTKQNHKSRKTYNTHNTRNTQQRKKHNKQKSHKNKHM